jgi:predicted lipid-binding transport protein (Tim44 family)
MKHGNHFWWTIRVTWPLLGGVWGTWLGFGSYLRLPQNADSFATVFALGFFSFFAWVGLFAGMASGALTGGLVERLLRRFGAGIAGAMIVATLVNALVLWQIAGLVQTKFPGLRYPIAKPPAYSTTKLPLVNFCAHPPSKNSKERAIWNSECR